MYFYVYQDQMYWGRHGALATQRNVISWIFRNKPIKLGRCYISGPYVFHVTRSNPFGSWTLTVSYKGETFHSFLLTSYEMYYLRDGLYLSTIDRHQEARNCTERAFKNRLREYRGKYFLPFHKHAHCM